MNSSYKLAIISDWIRRDLNQPLKWFDHFKVTHLYYRAGYGDMTAEEFKNTQKFNSARELYRLLKKLQPQIIQGPEPWASRASFLDAVAVYIFARRFKVPFVFPVFENRPIREKLGFAKSILVKNFMKLYARAATSVIYLNEGAKKNILTLGVPPDKLQKLYWGTWGMDLNEFKPGRKAAEPTVLFVGKVERAKGIPWLLEAFNLVLKELPNAVLLIAGPSLSSEPKLQGKNVRYLGIVKNKDLPELFQRAWVTAAPSITTRSWEEQVGMVNLQSLACATPVVTTESGAIPEYVPSSAAIFVPEKDSKQLAKGIIKLLKDKSLNSRLGRSGRRYAEQHYNAIDNIHKAQKMLIKIIQSQR